MFVKTPTIVVHAYENVPAVARRIYFAKDEYAYSISNFRRFIVVRVRAAALAVYKIEKHFVSRSFRRNHVRVQMSRRYSRPLEIKWYVFFSENHRLDARRTGGDSASRLELVEERISPVRSKMAEEKCP